MWITDDAGERKLGQIGIRVARGVALHGFALNIDPDMSAFEAIVPCGIADAGVTTLAIELERAGRAPVTVRDVLPAVERHLHEVLGAVEVPRTATPAEAASA